MAGTCWNANLPDLYTATQGGGSGTTLRLLVELLPCGRWEWLAWRGRAEGHCLRGEAGDRTAAMLAAEQGATLLKLVGREGSPATTLLN